ncbi:hypothetical protein AVEN_182658-1 [Araneus ventricosus]|uniref:Uncharacterized protein n=1 Tax=Araneus ventricosus TaxID=182803 RepID=A0A4Y2PZ87_ARAVE|nr:hypothetical protein AVEN_182658-1 [Araneus ventricosus]
MCGRQAATLRPSTSYTCSEEFKLGGRITIPNRRDPLLMPDGCRVRMNNIIHKIKICFHCTSEQTNMLFWNLPINLACRGSVLDIEICSRTRIDVRDNSV